MHKCGNALRLGSVCRYHHLFAKELVQITVQQSKTRYSNQAGRLRLQLPLAKTYKNREQLPQNYLQKLSVTNNNCSFHSVEIF